MSNRSAGGLDAVTRFLENQFARRICAQVTLPATAPRSAIPSIRGMITWTPNASASTNISPHPHRSRTPQAAATPPPPPTRANGSLLNPGYLTGNRSRGRRFLTAGGCWGRVGA